MHVVTGRFNILVTGAGVKVGCFSIQKIAVVNMQNGTLNKIYE